MPRKNGGGGADTPRSKPQSPLRIAHDGEFFARLLTKESSHGNPSFRYYGAGPGAVPFVWESHPGTPKDAAYSSSDSAVVPAITPPPSYHLRATAAGAGGPHGHSSRRHGKGAGGKVKYCGYKLNKWIKIGFIATVFRRLASFGGKSSSRSSSASSPPTSVKSSSSSTRWLFSGSGAAETRDLQEYSCYEPAAPAPATTTKGTLCSLGVRPSPWMLQFWGGGRREPAGWAYGVRSS